MFLKRKLASLAANPPVRFPHRTPARCAGYAEKRTGAWYEFC